MAAKKKTPRRRRSSGRQPIAARLAKLKALALTFPTMAEADQQWSGRVPLAELLGRDSRYEAAWQRGRFLRRLRTAASAPLTPAETAKQLDLMGAEEFEQLLRTDPEIQDTWEQTRHDAIVRIRYSLVKLALDGNQAAIRAVEGLLRVEAIRLGHREAAGDDLQRITLSQLVKLVGKSRQTIHDWVTKYELPRNADKTFDLYAVVPWLIEHVSEQAARTRESGELDRLKQIKAEKLEVELRKHRHELLDREEVMAGILARHQIVVTWTQQKAEQLARLCMGQKPERIADLIRSAMAELCQELCRVPAELHLPDGLGQQFEKLLKELNNE